MTKKEIINELHRHGELWANESYSKKELQDYLNGLLRAQTMSLEELSVYITQGE